MLLDTPQGLAPRAVQHPNVDETAYELRWVGDRGMMSITARYATDFDATGWLLVPPRVAAP